MADAPVLLRRAGTKKPVRDLEVPVGVPMKPAPPAESLPAGDKVVAAQGTEKISSSTLPIYVPLPRHRFKS